MRWSIKSPIRAVDKGIMTATGWKETRVLLGLVLVAMTFAALVVALTGW
jgi:hypothetical protein